MTHKQGLQSNFQTNKIETFAVKLDAMIKLFAS